MLGQGGCPGAAAHCTHSGAHVEERLPARVLCPLPRCRPPTPLLLVRAAARPAQADLDVTNPLVVVVPCLLMAVVAHPSTRHFIVFRVRAAAGCRRRWPAAWAAAEGSGEAPAAARRRCLRAAAAAAVLADALSVPPPQILWAFCVYLEAVSVLPQLRMMQKAKVGCGGPGAGGSASQPLRLRALQPRRRAAPPNACLRRARPAARPPQVVEKFTAHYVFALGLSRFISCAHWILQVRRRWRRRAQRRAAACVSVWGRIDSRERLRPWTRPASRGSSPCTPCSPAHAPPHPAPPSRPRSWTATSTCGRRWAAGCGPSWSWSPRLCRPSSWRTSATGAQRGRGTGEQKSASAGSAAREAPLPTRTCVRRARATRAASERRRSSASSASSAPARPAPPDRYVKSYADGTGVIHLPAGIV